jgi:hypothetical protein
LKEDAQQDIIDLAREELLEEWTEDDEKEWGDQKDDIIAERVDDKLWEWYRKDKFLFRL